jgi:hypothetical protein
MDENHPAMEEKDPSFAEFSSGFEARKFLPGLAPSRAPVVP